MDSEDIESILSAGAATADLKIVNDDQALIVVPSGYEVQDVPRKHFDALRKRRRVTLHEAASFIGYYLDFSDEKSRIFFDEIGETFTAYLDYHGPAGESARWCEHIAIYKCLHSVEWDTWIGKNHQVMTQTVFGQFIEDNLPDIAEPPGATVLQVCRSLEAKKDVTFVSSVRMADGSTQFLYEEEIKGTAAKGTLDIPDAFVLGLRPLRGGDAYKVEAKFRYRIKDGTLTMWYDLVRPHKVMEAALGDVYKKIESETSRSILKGTT
jgi:uncharacterized protein YfdQ (DUF2303 family)